MKKVYIEFTNRTPETFDNVTEIWIKDGFLNVLYTVKSGKERLECYELHRITEFWVT